MDLLLALHSIVRWLIVVVAVIAVVKFAYGWLQENSAGNTDRMLMTGYAGLLDLQVLLGLAYLLWNGLTDAGFPGYRIVHAIVMLLAVVVAHLSQRVRASGSTVLRNQAFGIVGSLALILVGVALLPGGWSR